MTLELSAEEIVTNLLSSNEVIKAKCENKYISYQDIDLGKYSMRIENSSELNDWNSSEFVCYLFFHFVDLYDASEMSSIFWFWWWIKKWFNYLDKEM